MSFVPKTGAIVDQLVRPAALDEHEQQLADWAQARGLAVFFGKMFPHESDDWEPYLTYDLVIERMVGDEIYARYLQLGDRLPIPGVLLDHSERMLRLLFERDLDAARSSSPPGAPDDPYLWESGT